MRWLLTIPARAWTAPRPRVIYTTHETSMTRHSVVTAAGGSGGNLLLLLFFFTEKTTRVSDEAYRPRLRADYCIPTEIGLAAAKRVCIHLSAVAGRYALLQDLLTHPLQIAGRSFKYRFAAHLAECLVRALSMLSAVEERGLLDVTLAPKFRFRSSGRCFSKDDATTRLTLNPGPMKSC